MSVQAMAWALRQDIVSSPTMRHVLLCLANYAGEDGRGAFPSVSRLARETGLSERAVQTNIAKLAEAGAIRPGHAAVAAAWIGRQDRRPNVWDLAVERGEPAAPRAVNGVQLTTERGAPAAPEPSLILKASVLPDGLPAIAATAWAGFDDMRRKRDGTAWTPRAKELAVMKLLQLVDRGEDPVAVLDQSTLNTWAGLFPVKPEGASYARTQRPAAGSLADRARDANRIHDERERGAR